MSRASGPESRAFRSALLQAIERGLGAPSTAGAVQWRGWLDGAQRRGEFRQAERDWIGVDDWLEAQAGKVRREDLLLFVRGNQLRLRESLRGGPSFRIRELDLWAVEVEEWNEEDEPEPVDDDEPVEVQRRSERFYIPVPLALEDRVEFLNVERFANALYELNDSGNVVISGRFEQESAFEDAVADYLVSRYDVSTTEYTTVYEEHLLPGGENYRELLLTLPLPDELPSGYRVESNPSTAAIAKKFIVLDKAGERYASGDTEAEAIENFARNHGQIAGTYKSPHFDHALNILVHVRFDERMDTKGSPLLMIQEIQSDWAQKGRRVGFMDEGHARFMEAELTQVLETMQALAADRDSVTNQMRDEPRWHRLADQRDRLVAGIAREVAGTVADMPFKATQDWAMLAFKRMVRWAAENGFDRVAWTTGEQQVERYNLGKQVECIHVLPPRQDRVNELRQVQIEFSDTVGPGWVALHVDDSGIVRNSTLELSGRGQIVGGPLSELLGKSIADKAMAAGEPVTLKEGDLSIGGDGMKAFYDTILPAAVGKWAKKFAGVVGQVDVPLDDYARRCATVHALDITPAMREAALAGLPLFKRPAPPADDDDDRPAFRF